MGKYTKEDIIKIAQNCKNPSDLQRNFLGAYKSAKRNGWLEEVCMYLPKSSKKIGYWTKETCHDVALRCKNKSEFIQKYSGAYKFSMRNGFFNEITSHFTTLYKPYGYWNNKENVIKYIKEKSLTTPNELRNYSYPAYKSMILNDWIEDVFPNRKIYNYSKNWAKASKEDVRKKASEYKIASKFQAHCLGAYNVAKKNGWLDEFFSIKRILTYDICKKEIAKYETYSELYQKDVSVLQKVIKKGWNDLIDHFEIPFSNRNPKWTYERCKEEVKKFKYLSDLQGTSVVNAMRQNGWLEELTSHLIRQQNKPYTKEEVLAESLKYKTRNDFRVGATGHYGAAKRLKIMGEATKHMGKSKVEKQYTIEELIESANKYTNQRDWLINEPSVYRCAVGYKKPSSSKEDKEFWKQLTNHMEYIFKPNGYWTYEKCKEVALKFNTVKDFKENITHRSVYTIIKKNGWLDLLSHLKTKHIPKGYWTYEKCKKEALKFTSRSEFCKSKESGGAYRKILIAGWFELFSHMKRKMTLKFRHIYACEFKKSKRVYVGLTCQVDRRRNQHLGVESNKTVSPVRNYMDATGETMKFKVLTRRPVKEENAPQIEDGYMKKYQENGWILLNKAKAGSLGGTFKWTYEKIKSMSEGCKTIREFNKKIPSWGRKHLTKDQLNELTKNLIRENVTWTEELCREVAIKCPNKAQFQRKYSGAYKFAIKMKLLNDLFPIK